MPIIENFLEDNVMPPRAWWYIVCGNLINKKVLMVGDLSPGDICSIALFSQSVDFYSNKYEIEKNMFKCIKNVNILDDFVINNNKYDVVIVSSFQQDLDNNKKINDFINSLILYQDCLTNNGIVSILVKNPDSLLNFKTINKFINKFYPFNNTGIFSNLVKKIKKTPHSNNVNIYPCLQYGDVIYEILTNYGYRSVKNSNLIKEKIKNFIYSSRLKHILCDSYVINYQADSLFMSFDDELLIKFKQKKIKGLLNNTQPCITRKQLNRGKVLLSISTDKNGEPEYIVIVALTKKVEKQRDNEYKVISKLSTINHIKQYIPKVQIKEYVGNIPCFFIQELKGITFDYPHENIEELTLKAYSLIKEISIPTIKPVQNEEDVSFVNDCIEQWMIRLPFFNEKIRIIGDYINKFLKENNTISIVMHGDYKIENSIFDEEQLSVVGVIDWELAHVNGMPFMDVLFLLIYNRVSCSLQPETFEEAYYNILTNKVTKFEKEIIDDYCNELKIDNKYKNVLIAVFFTHHYAYRRMLTNPDADKSNEINNILDVITGSFKNEY